VEERGENNATWEEEIKEVKEKKNTQWNFNEEKRAVQEAIEHFEEQDRRTPLHLTPMSNTVTVLSFFGS